MSDMSARLEALVREHADVEARLGDPEIHSDQDKFRDVSRRYKELNDIVTVWQERQQANDDRATAEEMASELSGDDRAEMAAEASLLSATIAELDERLQVLLLPKDPNDDKNVIVEIRGTAGGEEANLFARDLYEMFSTYAKRQSWGLEMMGAQPSDMGGFSVVTFMLKGESVWTRMKHEGGTHRVQRVPVTESQGRVHTSAATVTVLPEADEVEVEVDENDLQIDVYRSSGPGGQSVNTTDSAVRITHKPTGLVVAMQDEKSQLQNKAKALRVLRARLLQAEQDKQRQELSAARKDQVKTGDRSEKIRTYNFKENRVSDHRIKLTVHNLDKVLAGELDEISDALVQNERSEQLRGQADE